MRTEKYILLLFCFTLFIMACERDVIFSGDELSPRMVVNSIVNSNANENSITISESDFLFDNKKAEKVKDATFRLLHNGTELPITLREEGGNNLYYDFTAALKAGDRLEISGESPIHGKVSGSDCVPYPAEIKDLKTEWFTGEKDDRSYLRTLITIADNAGEKNYYRIVIRDKTIFKDINGEVTSSDDNWIQKEVFVDQEVLFSNVGNLIVDDNPHRYRIFSDDLINGKDYTLNVYVQMDRYTLWEDQIVEKHLKVEIHTLSENLFKYLYSLELAASEDNFSEPVKIYSNIVKGYGILGIYNVAENIVEIPMK